MFSGRSDYALHCETSAITVFDCCRSVLTEPHAALPALHLVRDLCRYCPRPTHSSATMQSLSCFRGRLPRPPPSWQKCYSHVSPSSTSIISESGDEEKARILQGSSPGALAQRTRIIPKHVLSVANLLALTTSCTLFGTWFYDNNLRLNP